MQNFKLENNKIISLKLAQKIILLLVIILFFEFFLFPMPILASELEPIANISNNNELNDNNESEEAVINVNKPLIINSLPENNDWQAVKTSYRTITAYNSEAAQCDNSPCITANGFNICEYGIEDTVAANFLPFGTKIRIPELFGNKVFIVRDRMNKRYSDRLDIWMLEKQNAIKFGVKIAKIEILDP